MALCVCVIMIRVVRGRVVCERAVGIRVCEWTESGCWSMSLLVQVLCLSESPGRSQGFLFRVERRNMAYHLRQRHKTLLSERESTHNRLAIAAVLPRPLATTNKSVCERQTAPEPQSQPGRGETGCKWQPVLDSFLTATKNLQSQTRIISLSVFTHSQDPDSYLGPHLSVEAPAGLDRTL
jgi:hypothetical protein